MYPHVQTMFLWEPLQLQCTLCGYNIGFQTMNKFYMSVWISCVFIHAQWQSGRHLLAFRARFCHIQCRLCIIAQYLHPRLMMVRPCYKWPPLMTIRNMCSENFHLSSSDCHSFHVSLNLKSFYMLYYSPVMNPNLSLFGLLACEWRCHVMSFSSHIILPSCLFLSTTWYCLPVKKGDHIGPTYGTWTINPK